VASNVPDDVAPGSDPFAAVRDRFIAAGLSENDLASDPVEHYLRWLDEARRVGVDQADAAVVSTADRSGRVTGRHVLIRGAGADGFRFYTNYRSEKGRQLDERPWAALTVPWAMIGRQVRIEGPTEKLDDADSDGYWATRPRGSQIAARASRQSESAVDRADIEARAATEAARWEGRDVPRPQHWGGFVVRPLTVEFWQAGADRLHDRLAFRRAAPDDPWAVTRLDP
jgi:pyridoxamine 5'-phosphate oxidase